MLKILIVFVLIAIGHIWAASLSCESCGAECVPACGTRRFRICCFNHLKRKRGSDLLENEDIPEEPELFAVRTVFVFEVPQKIPLISGTNPHIRPDHKTS